MLRATSASIAWTMFSPSRCARARASSRACHSVKATIAMIAHTNATLTGMMLRLTSCFCAARTICRVLPFDYDRELTQVYLITPTLLPGFTFVGLAHIQPFAMEMFAY